MSRAPRSPVERATEPAGRNGALTNPPAAAPNKNTISNLRQPGPEPSQPRARAAFASNASAAGVEESWPSRCSSCTSTPEGGARSAVGADPGRRPTVHGDGCRRSTGRGGDEGDARREGYEAVEDEAGDLRGVGRRFGEVVGIVVVAGDDPTGLGEPDLAVRGTQQRPGGCRGEAIGTDVVVQAPDPRFVAKRAAQPLDPRGPCRARRAARRPDRPRRDRRRAPAGSRRPPRRGCGRLAARSSSPRSRPRSRSPTGSACAAAGTGGRTRRRSAAADDARQSTSVRRRSAGARHRRGQRAAR